LLALQALGEVLARGLHLPYPGPVVGMLLLWLALRWPAVQQRVGPVCDTLLAHLSLLFVPVGVGVMTHLGLLGTYGWRLLGVIVLSTWIGLAVTALVVRALMRADGPAPSLAPASPSAPSSSAPPPSRPSDPP
jgi:holin-like protein